MPKTPIIQIHNGRPYELVAAVTATVYKVRVKESDSNYIWKETKLLERSNVIKSEVSNYVPPRNYNPHHLKDFKRLAKWMMEKNWPSYRKLPNVT